jgi:hypothetical protein
MSPAEPVTTTVFMSRSFRANPGISQANSPASITREVTGDAIENGQRWLMTQPEPANELPENNTVLCEAARSLAGQESESDRFDSRRAA